MILSKSQQLRFWREWSAACRAQGWTKAQSWTGAQIDNERHALLERCGFDSLTKVDKQSGFDRVLKELATLQANLAGMLSADENPRRVLVHGIRKHGFNDAYVAAISIDRFGTTDWQKLPLDLLTKLRNTIADRAVVEHLPETIARRRAARRARSAAVPAAATNDNEPF